MASLVIKILLNGRLVFQLIHEVFFLGFTRYAHDLITKFLCQLSHVWIDNDKTFDVSYRVQ